MGKWVGQVSTGEGDRVTGNHKWPHTQGVCDVVTTECPKHLSDFIHCCCIPAAECEVNPNSSCHPCSGHGVVPSEGTNRLSELSWLPSIPLWMEVTRESSSKVAHLPR